MKRMWPIFLGAIFLTDSLAQAESTSAQARFIYKINKGAITITEVYFPICFRGPCGPVTIPSTIDGLPVTAIGETFSDPYGLCLTSLTIPASVTNITDHAFEDDQNLAHIYFEGNAPAFGPCTFLTHAVGPTTAHYLAGTSGWSDLPIATAPWNPQGGSLQVTIRRPGKITTGAQWRLDDGPINDSGATVANLAAGDHTISFLPVSGWSAPAAKTVTIKTGAITKTKVVYKPTRPNNHQPHFDDEEELAAAKDQSSGAGKQP